MTYSIHFSKEAGMSLAKYKRSKPSAFAKVSRLMAELEAHPRTGTGHPEPLRNGNCITWSRRITGRDRLVYDIDDDDGVVLIVRMEGHYADK